VNQPQTLRESKRLVFGLQATPVKPVPADWRAWREDYLYVPRLEKTMALDWKELGVPIQWRLLWWSDGYRRIFTEGLTTPLQIKPELAAR
jgi:hypothetical protein